MQKSAIGEEIIKEVFDIYVRKIYKSDVDILKKYQRESEALIYLENINDYFPQNIKGDEHIRNCFYKLNKIIDDL